jgi:hypothetical protein
MPLRPLLQLSIVPRACVVGTLVSLTSAISPASGQRITPQFQWGVPALAEIYGGEAVVLTRSGVSDTSHSTMTSRLEISAHPSGVLVISGPATNSAFARTAGNPASDVVEAAIYEGSRFVVARNGVFQRAEDTVRTKAHMDSIMAPLAAQMQSMAPQLAEAVRGGVTGESITAAARTSWHELGGFIFGRSWAPGDSVRDSLVQALPTMPGVALTLWQTTRYIGQAACPAKSGARTCWRFDGHTEIDVVGMRVAMMKMIPALPASTTPDQLPVPVTASTNYWIIDAATSRPVETGTTRSTTIKMNAAANIGMEMSSLNTSTLQYTWRSP